MPQPPIFKRSTDNLKNSLTAILGRGIRSIKRFATALHNKCNLVVYVDRLGKTCCQFLKKDAFTGYHFEFRVTCCLVTNKESGEIYLVEFRTSSGCRCNCPAFRYDRRGQHCRHIKMVAELRGDIESVIAPQAYQKDCSHPKAIPGMDAYYCPDCKKSIEYGTAEYELLLNRGRKPKVINIDPTDVPKGCRLERSDDWISIEYYVHIWQERNIRGERTLLQENIGRLVQTSKGIHAYRVRLHGSAGHTFDSTRDAIAYLVRIVGTNFDAIALACEQKEDRLSKHPLASCG